MDYVHVGLFFLATIGHLGLVPYWLERIWGEQFASPEESFFHAVLFGFGSLQVVLHVLASTVGISLYAGVAILGCLHLVLLVLTSRMPQPRHSRESGNPVRRQKTRKQRRAESKPGKGQRLVPGASAAFWRRLPWLTLVGATGIACVVLSWLYRAPESAQILGIDSTHYHAPYAINYGLGVNLFGQLATPHVYPVGASVTGAWFFQPFSDVLFLDLTNLLPFLLLFASLLYLFRVLTDWDGWEWAPLIFLLLFTGKMFRVSVFVSADLLYAASFAALFVQLCAVWARNGLRSYDWWGIGLSVGLLLSSKIQGLMSAVLLFGFFSLALLVRTLLPGGKRPELSFSVSRLAWCLVLVVASGGVWLIRNWWYFGSPMAPAGLKILGVTIFAGSSGQGGWLSIAKDLRDIPDYNLTGRFLTRSREWVGAWQGVVTFGLIGLLADLGYRLMGRRRLSTVTKRKLFGLLFFAALFFVHGYILVYTISTSIEILNGQTLRYIMPFFALYPLLLYSLFFTESPPFGALLRHAWIVMLPILLYVLYDYNDLSATPSQWNRSYGREDLLDYRWMPLALLMVAPWCVRMPGAWKQYGRYGSIGFVAVFTLLLAGHSVSQNRQLSKAAHAAFESRLDEFSSGANVRRVDEGILYAAVTFARRQGMECERLRFFNLSRYDFPVKLQDPDFDSVVINVEPGHTRNARDSWADGPGAEPCDYVVAVHQETVVRKTKYAAVPEDEILQVLAIEGQLRPIGDSGHYRIYHVRPG